MSWQEERALEATSLLHAQLGCCRKTVLMVTATGKGERKALGTGLDTGQQPLLTKDFLWNILALYLK